MEGGASGTTPYLIEPERDYKKYIFVHRGDEASREGGCRCGQTAT